MSLLEYLRDILVTDETVTNITGNRIYCSNPAQIATDPYLVLILVYSTAEDGLQCMLDYESATVQMEAYSYQQGKSYNLWKVAREALKPYQRGFTTDLAIRGIAQSSGVSVDAFDPLEGSDKHLYRTRQDFEITYTYQ